MADKTYPVMEIFGPTIQGEGAMAGRPTHFIRMGGCDYRCNWCDTSFSVLPEEVRKHAMKMTVPEMLVQIASLHLGPEWVTISGGNPALHDLTQLVERLHIAKFKVAVETQGSLWKDWLLSVDQLTISPKPPSSGMYDTKNLNRLGNFMEALGSYYYRTDQQVCLKVPVYDEADYEFAMMIHGRYQNHPFYFSVVTEMGGLHGDYAEGRIDTRDTLLDRYRWLAETVAADPRAADTTSFPQLHALLWGHGRGF